MEERRDENNPYKLEKCSKGEGGNMGIFGAIIVVVMFLFLFYAFISFQGCTMLPKIACAEDIAQTATVETIKNFIKLHGEKKEGRNVDVCFEVRAARKTMDDQEGMEDWHKIQEIKFHLGLIHKDGSERTGIPVGWYIETMEVTHYFKNNINVETLGTKILDAAPIDGDLFGCLSIMPGHGWVNIPPTQCYDKLIKTFMTFMDMVQEGLLFKHPSDKVDMNNAAGITRQFEIS